MRAVFQALDGLIDRLPISPRFFRFCVVGTSGMAVSFVALGLLYWVFPQSWGVWEHRAAIAGSIAIAIFTNFLLNYYWTWGDTERAASMGGWLYKLGKFYLVSSVAASVQWGVAVVIYEQFGLDALLGPPGLYVAQATGIATAMFINFFANHLWTFSDEARTETDPR